MRACAALLAALVLAACDAGTQERRDVGATRVVMRSPPHPPTGTVPRGAGTVALAMAAPGPGVTPALLARGRERFTVFCTPCHGSTGRGDGIVVSRGFPRPPAYREARLLDLPPEHVVTVITNGFGVMSSYAERIPPDDRWAIAHHVKALQNLEERSSLERPAP